MNENYIKDEIQAAVQSALGIHVTTSEIELEKPVKKDFGDLATNISFVLAQKLGHNPAEIASKLSAEIQKTQSFEKVTAIGGFINFTFSKQKYLDDLNEILTAGEHYGETDEYKGKKVQVEYISANPTGPLHLGNGRGGFGGDTLANVYKKAGAIVEREYYINDGGNQVQILGNSVLIEAGIQKPEGDYYQGSYISDWVEKNKAKIKQLKENPGELGYLASIDILENHIKPTVKKMNINFDNWFSEKAMIEKGEVEQLIQKLRSDGQTEEKEGALWMRTKNYGDEKDRVLIKSDGQKTYFANDFAYHFDKFTKRKFDKVVNFWGADHHGYVGRMQAATTALGYRGQLDIVIMQLVRLIKNGKEYKMSKRKGVIVTVDELLELIGGNPKEASDTARFFFLMRDFNTHMDFDLDLAREHSEKNPVFYVKYANARLCGILAKAKELKLPKADINLLGQKEEIDLIESLTNLKPVVSFILKSGDYPVHQLTYLSIEIAKKFHHFYDKCQVIDEKNLDLTAARLKLVEATKIVLNILGHDLIGVEMPERM